MLVVADTSPLNYLVLIRQETLLPVLYERVVIPPAVHEELQRAQTPDVVRRWAAALPAWLTVHRPQRPLVPEPFPQLHAGEREAILLVQELHADVLLIDDMEGRAEALRCAIAITGTLGVLETAAVQLQKALKKVMLRRDVALEQMCAGENHANTDHYHSGQP